MKTLTLKNVPDDLYNKLGAAAKANQRSLNRQTIVQLERSFEIGETDIDEDLACLDQLRGRLGFVANAQELSKAKTEGRP